MKLIQLTLIYLIIMYILIVVLKALLIALPLIIAVAYFTLVERKVMAGIQRRRGPDVVGAWGLFNHLRMQLS